MTLSLPRVLLPFSQALRQLGDVRSADPVRRSLNRGLAWVILTIALLAGLMAGVLAWIGRPPSVVMVAAVTVPLCALCWWLNRRGDTAGALAFAGLLIAATTLGIDPHLYAGRVPVVDIAFMYSVVAAALFVRPAAGVVAGVLQLLALTLALAVSDIPRGQALRFLAEAVLEMGAMAALVTVAATIFVRALHELQRHAEEQRRLEDERRAREAAEAANEAKTRFLASMSHELRTPLNAILGFSQLMQQDPDGSEAQRRHAGFIRESGMHLLALIEDVLDIARVEAGRLSLFPAPLALAGFLDSVAATGRMRAAQKRLAFDFHAAPGLPSHVMADEKRLRQVLLNLLDNACKFTERGRVGLRVDALPVGTPGAARLRFEVDDTGVGIAREHVDAVFRPFEQVGDSQSRRGGAGLGLAISRELVRLMDSEIELASRPGHGSRFWFDLALEVPALAASGPRPTMPRGFEGPPRTVLIADDVARNRALLRDLLTPLGFGIHEAADGQEAVDRAQRIGPDLVLIDSVMPGVDGITAIGRMRATPQLRDVPIISVSASAMTADRERCLAAGANAFLSKPVDVFALLDQIERTLGLRWTYTDS
jgi:signal transduction histidine kinase/ActR/RegA family two-component response regulator